ncbi:hypothetical protein NSQ43_01625 [Sporosarcina sp. FSL W8-0480]|uniref:hypothetical protein n=1 Tax=Sporosarcina sp. FSL W8-0480 TaxID=2954701 RepID=UPI0030DB2317
MPENDINDSPLMPITINVHNRRALKAPTSTLKNSITRSRISPHAQEPHIALKNPIQRSRCHPPRSRIP